MDTDAIAPVQPAQAGAAADYFDAADAGDYDGASTVVDDLHRDSDRVQGGTTAIAAASTCQTSILFARRPSFTEPSSCTSARGHDADHRLPKSLAVDVDFVAEMGHDRRGTETKHRLGAPRFELPEPAERPTTTAAAAAASAPAVPAAHGGFDMLIDSVDAYYVPVASLPAAAAAEECSTSSSDDDSDTDPVSVIAAAAADCKHAVVAGSSIGIAASDGSGPGQKPPAPVVWRFDPQKWFAHLYSSLQTSVSDVLVQNTLLTNVILPVLEQLKLLSTIVYLFNLKTIATHLVLCWMCCTASSYRSTNFLLGIIGALVNQWCAGRVSFPSTMATLLNQNAYLKNHCKIIPRVYCQLCYTVYTQEECTHIRAGVCRTKVCSHKEFPLHPNPAFRSACGSALMGKKNQKIVNGTTVKFDLRPYPSQTYYYLGTLCVVCAFAGARMANCQLIFFSFLCTMQDLKTSCREF